MTAEAVFIRDTKDAQAGVPEDARPTLSCDPEEWERFCQQVGQVTMASVDTGALRLDALADHSFVLSSRTSDAQLHFTQAEIDAFVLGVRASEFSALIQPELALTSLH